VAGASRKGVAVAATSLGIGATALAIKTRNASASAYAWTATRTRVLTQASSEAALSGFSWASAKGHVFALASRDAAAVGFAWTAATTRTIAQASSEATSRGMSWARLEGNALAIATRDAGAAGSAWTAEKSRALARVSLSAALTGGLWMRTEAKDLTHKLHHAGTIASPWVRAKADEAAVRLQRLKTVATEVAHRQSEQASLIALRLSAQAKGDLDALRRAARAGELTPAAWRKFMATGVELKQEPRETIEGPKSEAEPDGLQNGARVSSNALICIEPWRCRLPMVQTESPSGRFAPPG